MKDITLEARIQHLEGQLKIQRWFIGGLLLAALAAAGVAATTSDVSNEIKTKKLVVVNDKGEQAIWLTSEKDGGVAVFFNGEGLAPVLVVAARPTGGELVLKGARGVNLVEMSGDKSGTGHVSVSVGGTMRQLETGAK